jgi:hypothetical protein
MLAETADAADPFDIWAAQSMYKRIRDRALDLSATHIVWLHKTDHSAAAEAYRCTTTNP